MSSPETIVLINGVGDEPLIQQRVPELWKYYGLQVVRKSIDFSRPDYLDQVEELEEHVKDLHQEQNSKMAIVGLSGGGKTGLSIYAHLPDIISGVVTICTKVTPYDMQPETSQAFPGLQPSSDLLEKDLLKITPAMRRNILCLRPFRDRQVDPRQAVLPGAHDHTLFAFDHLAALKRALTLESYVVANFALRHRPQ